MLNPHSTLPTGRHSLRRLSGQPQALARLICFTWCGAGASAYRRLALSLTGEIELQAVQLPGREELYTAPKLLRMEQIIEHVLPELLAFNDDLPLILFGHSMGALLAYEMALRLQTHRGKEARLLIVSGHGSPDSREHCKGLWHTASEDEFIANIAQLGGTPPELLADRAMMRMLIPALRADYEVLETYTPTQGQLLSCPIIACAGDQDKEVSQDSLNAWRHTSSEHFTCHWFQGDHFYLSSQPRALTRHLEKWIMREIPERERQLRA